MHKSYRQTNKEKIAQAKKVHNEENKEHIAQYHKERRKRQYSETADIRQQHPYAPSHRKSEYLKGRYNITSIEWFMLLEYQGYRCVLCGKPLNFRQNSQRRGRIVVDHNHDTGEIRGLMHVYCNVALGIIENPEILHSALKHIESNGIYDEFKGFLSRLEDKNK